MQRFVIFQAVNQLDEAKTIMRDIQNLLGWSILQPQGDAIQVCNLQNIQQISKQEEFQKIKQLLGWEVNIQQHSKYVESIKVYAAPDFTRLYYTCLFSKRRLCE